MQVGRKEGREGGVSGVRARSEDNWEEWSRQKSKRCTEEQQTRQQELSEACEWKAANRDGPSRLVGGSASGVGDGASDASGGVADLQRKGRTKQ